MAQADDNSSIIRFILYWIENNIILYGNLNSSKILNFLRSLSLEYLYVEQPTTGGENESEGRRKVL